MGYVTPELAMLLLVALLGMYVGFGKLHPGRRVVARFGLAPDPAVHVADRKFKPPLAPAAQS